MIAYEMCISNIATYIQSKENKEAIQIGEGIDAFQASVGISLGFCKHKETVVYDLVNYKNKVNISELLNG